MAPVSWECGRTKTPESLTSHTSTPPPPRVFDAQDDVGLLEREEQQVALVPLAVVGLEDLP